MEATAVGSDIDATLIVAILALFVAALGLAFQIAPKPESVESTLDTDPTYRQETAEALRNGSLGQRYRDGLERGLARLDHNFGPPGSAAALSLCFTIALAYAYAGFFLVWGIGGPGIVGGFAFLPQSGEQPGRIALGAQLALLPLAAFWFGRRIGPPAQRLERRMVTRLQRARRRQHTQRRSVYRVYRFALAISFLVVVAATAVVLPEPAIDAGGFGLLIGSLGVLGVISGIVIQSKMRSNWTAGLASTTAGALAVAIAFAVAIALVMAGAGAFAIASAVAATVTVAATFSVAVAVTAAVAVAGAVAAAGAIASAAAGAAAVAVAVGLIGQKGAVPGAVGGMIGLAMTAVIGGLGFVDEWAIALLIFFLVLPLVNSVVDWVSWWVTRRLGARLLASFDAGAGSLRLGLVALGHGVADLALAAVMLLAMAFVLALGFEAYNQASLWTGPDPAFDLEAYVVAAAAAPFSEGAWLSLMLLTTLVPTFLHVVVVWMSPLGLLFLSARREAWADGLAGWEELDEAERSRTRRAVAAWVAHGRIGLWLLAGLLALGIFALMAAAITLVHQGGFADYVAQAAYFGIDFARWLGRQ